MTGCSGLGRPIGTSVFGAPGGPCDPELLDPEPELLDCWIPDSGLFMLLSVPVVSCSGLRGASSCACSGLRGASSCAPGLPSEPASGSPPGCAKRTRFRRLPGACAIGTSSEGAPAPSAACLSGSPPAGAWPASAAGTSTRLAPGRSRRRCASRRLRPASSSARSCSNRARQACVWPLPATTRPCSMTESHPGQPGVGPNCSTSALRM